MGVGISIHKPPGFSRGHHSSWARNGGDKVQGEPASQILLRYQAWSTYLFPGLMPRRKLKWQVLNPQPVAHFAHHLGMGNGHHLLIIKHSPVKKWLMLKTGSFFIPFPIKWVGLLILKRNTFFLSQNRSDVFFLFFLVGCKMDHPLGGSSHLVSKSPRPGVVHLPNAIFMAGKWVWSKTLILSIGMILQVEKWLGYGHQLKLGLGSAGHLIFFPLNEKNRVLGDLPTKRPFWGWLVHWKLT